MSYVSKNSRPIRVAYEHDATYIIRLEYAKAENLSFDDTLMKSCYGAARRSGRIGLLLYVLKRDGPLLTIFLS